jgi:glucose-6-phosphate isomerase
MTITVEKIDAKTIGVLIALYERAVGLYASLLNINAYHQPGVEAGKKAAGLVLSLQKIVINFIHAAPGKEFTAETVAKALAHPEKTEQVFRILRHVSANPGHRIHAIVKNPLGETLFGADA